MAQFAVAVTAVYKINAYTYITVNIRDQQHNYRDCTWIRVHCGGRIHGRAGTIF